MDELLNRYVCPSGARPPRSAGPASPTLTTTSSGGCRTRAASGWSTSSRSACGLGPGPGRQRHRRRLGRRGARPPGADHRLRPPVRLLQAGRLLLSQPERLKALLHLTERPVQFVFAGKAHPADDIGKEMIRQIVQFSRDRPSATGSCSSRTTTSRSPACMYQGGDVWLNNPRRPARGVRHQRHEGGLQRRPELLVLDGWWDEMFDGDNGWAIASAESFETDRRDQVEAESLFDLLERQSSPCSTNVRRAGAPALGPAGEGLAAVAGPPGRRLADGGGLHRADVRAHRRRADTLVADGYARARDLAAWKQRVAKAWAACRSTAWRPTRPGRPGPVGVRRSSPSDLRRATSTCSSSTGRWPERGAAAPRWSPWTPGRRQGQLPPLHRLVRLDRAGRYGFTVRVVPRHPDLTSFAELGCATWAGSPAG